MIALHLARTQRCSGRLRGDGRGQPVDARVARHRASDRGRGPKLASPALGVAWAAVERPAAWHKQPWKRAREQLWLTGERACPLGLPRACAGRIGDCAHQTGIAERSLFEKMKRHALRKEDFRT